MHVQSWDSTELWCASVQSGVAVVRSLSGGAQFVWWHDRESILKTITTVTATLKNNSGSKNMIEKWWKAEMCGLKGRRSA